MCRSIARQMWDMTTTHASLFEVRELHNAKVETDKDQSVYTFEDKSTLTLDNYGHVRVDGRWML
jgi:hypothetical protein